MIADALLSLVVDIDSILPDPANPRKHTDESLGEVAASLRRFGQRTPLVANQKTKIIEKGNGTWQAAKKLGWSQVACLFVKDSDLKAREYAIADNRTAERSSWDEENLRSILEVHSAPIDIPGVDESWLYGVIEDMSKFLPSLDEPSQLDQRKRTKCPECGYEWGG